MGSISNWAWLPKNVLDMIIEKLVSVSGCIRFSLVCKSWRSAAIESFRLQSLNEKRHDNLHRQQIPLLVIPTEDNSHERRGLYSLTKKKDSGQQLDVPFGKRCCGSSHGWLFTMDETMSLYLLNPFSGAVICLPPIIGYYEIAQVQLEQEDALNHIDVDKDFQDEEDDEEEDEENEEEDEEDENDNGDDEDEDEEDNGNNNNNGNEGEEDHDINHTDEDNEDDELNLNFEYTVHKAVLSKDPDLYPDAYAVMIIYGNRYRLAFIKSGDKHWTYLHPKLQIYSDIIYSQGKFLCLRHWGDIWSCDIDKSPPKVEKIAPALKHYACMLTAYLVELPKEGEVVLAHRWLQNLKTYGFRVMKRQIKQGAQSKWVKTLDLGGAAIFLGGNYSTSVLASDHPGCQPDCIYFTDDFTDFFVHGTPYGYEICGGGGPCDNGFYNLKDGSFGKHYKLGLSQEHMPPPIWLIPKFK